VKENPLFRDRAWLTPDMLDSVRAELVEHVHSDPDLEALSGYSAAFYLVGEEQTFGVAAHFDDADGASLRQVRDAASVISGMLAALVEAIDRLVAEKSSDAPAEVSR
jgi:hypothetical protein